MFGEKTGAVSRREQGAREATWGGAWRARAFLVLEGLVAAGAAAAAAAARRHSPRKRVSSLLRGAGLATAVGRGVGAGGR